MTERQTAELLALLKEYYPQSFESSTLKNRVMAWHLILKDHDYQTIQNAMISFVSTDTKGFMPSVGQLVEKALNMTTKLEMHELEAWGYVAKAIRNGTYGSEEEFAKLPPAVQRTVGRPEQLREWALMEADEVHTVVASNFQRSYRAVAKQVKDHQALPQNVRDFIALSTGMLKEIPVGCTGPGPAEIEAVKCVLLEGK